MPTRSMMTAIASVPGGKLWAVGHDATILHSEDGGRRTCTSINLPEPVPPGSPAAAAGLATVADVTRARLRAVAAAYGGGLEERVG